MDGTTLEAGAVALLTRVRNPIRLARLVMERTDHVLVAGKGAERLAKIFGLENRDPLISDTRKSWRLLRAELVRGQLDHLTKVHMLIQELPDLLRSGTVGAVAQDREGRIGAGTSTGGLALRIPGRIGDTPLIGSGTYANNTGFCSVTGLGEAAIRLVLAKTTCDLMKRNHPAQKAAEQAVSLPQTRLGMGIGVVAIDSDGRIGAAHTTRDLCWGYVKHRMRGPHAVMK